MKFGKWKKRAIRFADSGNDPSEFLADAKKLVEQDIMTQTEYKTLHDIVMRKITVPMTFDEYKNKIAGLDIQDHAEAVKHFEDMHLSFMIGDMSEAQYREITLILMRQVAKSWRQK